MSKQTEWAKRVEAWRASGKSAREFCEGQDYPAKRLQWWAWRLRRTGDGAVSSKKSVDFARVVRKRGPTLSGQASIVVHVGAARVDVGTAADRATLTTVLDVLLASAGGGS